MHNNLLDLSLQNVIIYIYDVLTGEHFMKPKIYPKKIDGKIYYYYQYTKRIKINPKDTGKGPGSGKSKVYLNRS